MTSSVKLVIRGEGSVGKVPEYVPTVFDNYAAQVQVDGRNIELGLWDYGGRGYEEYDRLDALSYPQTDIFLLAFSVISPYSLERAKERWLPLFKKVSPKTPVIVVGTKVDLREDKYALEQLKAKGLQTISSEQGIAFAKEIGAVKYMECSALTGAGVKELFDEAIRTAMFPKETKTKKKGYVSVPISNGRFLSFLWRKTFGGLMKKAKP